MSYLTQLQRVLALPYLMVVGALLLSACSSQPEYRAAKGNGYGYSEQQITDNYYRVTFKARGDDSGAARGYALRRAAELTASQGYDWFVVVDKAAVTERERPAANQLTASYQQSTERSCSLLGCKTRTVNQPQPSYSASLSAGQREQVESVLEVRMGKGVMPDSSSAYPAGDK